MNYNMLFYKLVLACPFQYENENENENAEPCPLKFNKMPPQTSKIAFLAFIIESWHSIFF